MENIRHKFIPKYLVLTSAFLILALVFSSTVISMDEMKKNPSHKDQTEHSMHKKMDDMHKEKPALYWNSPANTSINNDMDAQQHDHDMAMKKPLPSIFEPIRHTRPKMTDSHAIKHLDPNYVCPMHPQIVQKQPGSCPICGMNLVARKNHVPDKENPQVFLAPSVIQNMGVKVTPVKKRALDNHILTQGIITADEDRMINIHPRTAGWIQKLYLLTEGDRVERKELLVDFYSPWINDTQLKYIAVLEEFDMLSFNPENRGEVNAKVDSLQNSLRMLNVMDMDIMRIKNNRKVQNTIQMLAPQGGVITDLNIREGTYIEPYQPMFTIVDLSQVWVMIDIYEHQAVSVRKGQQVSITTSAIPSRTWDGLIDYIYPEVNTQSRTLRARITVQNPDEALLLNMFVDVDIAINSKEQKVLTIPREALIQTGEREVVIKSESDGHFKPVKVSTGMRDDKYIEVLSGLHEDDSIVVSGQFLIDSESSLQASFLRLSK